jgi:hypothetical protein
MSDNYMRDTLVMRFACVVCGEGLKLSYRPGDKAKGRPSHSSEEPTGAAMVMQVTYIEPCRACLEPLRRLREAMKTLNEFKP